MPPSSQQRRTRPGRSLAIVPWALAWLGGTVAITGFSVTRHAPALERAMLEEVQRAVAPVGDAPILVSVRDHDVTLSGSVGDEGRREAMLAAAAASPGIRRVVDRLVVRDPTVAGPGAGAPPSATGPATLPAFEPATTSSSVSGAVLAQAPPPDELPPEELPDEEPSPGESLPGETSVEELPAGELSPEEERSPQADTPDGSPSEAPVSEHVLPPEELPPEELPSEALLPDVEPIDEDEPESPRLQLEIADGVLMIDGALSSEKDLETLVDTATQSFELDFVSNNVETRTGIAEADWIESVLALMPALARLDAPGIDVLERRITLRGTAPDRATLDEIVGMAMERLGDHSLDVRIDVAEEAIPSPASTGAAVSDGGVPSGGVAAETAETLDAAADDVDVPSGGVAVETAEALDAAADDVDAPSGGITAETSEALDAADTTGQSDAPADRGEADADVDSTDGPGTGQTMGEGASGTDRPDDGTAAGTEPTGSRSSGSLRSDMNALPSLVILFRSGSNRLTEESLETLDAIARTLLRHPDVPVAIGGHTDSAGRRSTNLNLSQLRANAVRDYLVSRGVSAERLSAHGYGESLPIADNRTAEGRAANRRIEFTY